jgi:tetratricopeptide (TPR) repeat protein/DNA-binding CsgD family transcriptional regulator
MKYLFLFLMCLMMTGRSSAQKDERYTVPDFVKIPAENRFDTINQWYIRNVHSVPGEISVKLQRLDAAMKYADSTKDPATKATITFFLGHYYAKEIDSLTGMNYMYEAQKMAEEQGLLYEWASFTHDFGVRNLTSDPARSLEYMIRADEVLKRIGATQKLESLVRSYNLGTLYFYLRNYNASIETLVPLIEGYERKASKIDQLQLNNTIGLSYREAGKEDSALFYFRKTMVLAGKEPRIPAWIGIAAGNIGSVYFTQQQFDSALIYARLNYDLVKNDSRVSGIGVAEALVLIAQVYTEQHKPEIALSKLQQAEQLIKEKQIYYVPNTDHLVLNIYHTYARAYEMKKNFSMANRYLQQAIQLQENLSNRDNEELYTKVQEHLEAEKNISRIREAENETAISVQRRNFFLIGLTLIGLILFSLYRRQQISNIKNRELFASKEQLLVLEKKRSEENLARYMENLQEKNRLIEHVEEEIEHLGAGVLSTEKHESLEALEKLKRYTIITSDDWIQFKSLFERVHPHFFSRLKEKFPDITPAEMRLMALVRLDVPTKKMAAMLGISPESIRKTEYRFIKKISHTGETDLSQIIDSF